VVLVVVAEDVHVVRVARGVQREGAHLVVEALQLAPAAVAEGAGVVGEHLALAQDAGVAVLAQLPAAMGPAAEVVEVGDPPLEVGRGPLAGLPEALARVVVLHVEPDQVPDVAHGALRRVHAPLDDERMGEFWIQVRDARVHRPPGLFEARDRRVHDVRLRAQPVEEQREQAAGDRAGVGERIPLPLLERGEDQAAAEHGPGEIAVDRLVGR
jgi:hypothetical protein